LIATAKLAILAHPCNHYAQKSLLFHPWGGHDRRRLGYGNKKDILLPLRSACTTLPNGEDRRRLGYGNKKDILLPLRSACTIFAGENNHNVLRL